MTKTERKHVSNARLNYKAGVLNGIQFAAEMFAVYSNANDLDGFRAWLVRAEEHAKNEHHAALDTYCVAADLNTKASF